MDWGSALLLHIHRKGLTFFSLFFYLANFILKPLDRMLAL
jgi:hypothetical protein